MLLQKVRTENGIIIEPAFENDKLLFKHCSNGNLQVPAAEFNKSVKVLLHAHGLTDIEIKDRTRETHPLSPLTEYHRNRKVKSWL